MHSIGHTKGQKAQWIPHNFLHPPLSRNHHRTPCAIPDNAFAFPHSAYSIVPAPSSPWAASPLPRHSLCIKCSPVSAISWPMHHLSSLNMELRDVMLHGRPPNRHFESSRQCYLDAPHRRSPMLIHLSICHSGRFISGSPCRTSSHHCFLAWAQRIHVTVKTKLRPLLWQWPCSWFLFC